MKKIVLVAALVFVAMNITVAANSFMQSDNVELAGEGEKEKKKCSKDCKDKDKKCCSTKSETAESNATPAKSCGGESKKSCCASKKK